MRQATLIEIKAFFGTPERPVTAPEMTKFWQSLTDSDKEYYKTEVGKTL